MGKLLRKMNWLHMQPPHLSKEAQREDQRRRTRNVGRHAVLKLPAYREAV